MALDEEAGVLHLEVEDYGRGIREDDRAGVGRHSMRERRGAGWYYQSAVGRGCHQRPALIEVADLEYLLKDMVSEDFDGNPDGNVARKRPEKVGLRDDSDTQKLYVCSLNRKRPESTGSGGTRIRNGDTMIFSHMPRPLDMR